MQKAIVSLVLAPSCCVGGFFLFFLFFFFVVVFGFGFFFVWYFVPIPASDSRNSLGQKRYPR